MIFLAALVCLALMTGNEICVAAFINPVLRRLPETQQIPFLRQAASYLGAIMPFWYAASLLLTAATAYALHAGGCGWMNLATWSALLQAGVIVMTITLMVPINNRLGKLREDETGWTSAAIRWDHFHQLRVVLLLVAIALLTLLMKTKT